MLCLIWGNSMLPGETSGAVSGGFLEWLSGFLGNWVVSEWFHHLLRKGAHFSVFLLLSWTVRWFLVQWRKPGKEILPTALLMGLMVAAMDEGIQHFVAGRASSVLDVWLDFGGFCFGTLAALALAGRKRK